MVEKAVRMVHRFSLLLAVFFDVLETAISQGAYLPSRPPSPDAVLKVETAKAPTSPKGSLGSSACLSLTSFPEGLPSHCGHFRVEHLTCRGSEGGGDRERGHWCTLEIVCDDAETETETAERDAETDRDPEVHTRNTAEGRSIGEDKRTESAFALSEGRGERKEGTALWSKFDFHEQVSIRKLQHKGTDKGIQGPRTRTDALSFSSEQREQERETRKGEQEGKRQVGERAEGLDEFLPFLDGNREENQRERGKGKGVEVSVSLFNQLRSLQSETSTAPSQSHSHTESATLIEELLIAARSGNATQIEALLSLSGSGGGGADTRDPSRWNSPTLLHIAAASGYRPVVAVLLRAGAEVEARDASQATPLHVAALFGSEAAVLALIEAGGEVEAKTAQGGTPLHLAAANGRLGVVSVLIEAGAEVDARDHRQQTPLHLAVWKDYIPIVSALLEAGAEMEAQTDTGSRPLHVAAQNGVIAGVSMLIAAGAEVEARDRGNFSPLHFAAQGGNTAVVSALIAAGAEVNGKTDTQTTPLHFAAREGHEAVVSLLVEAGAEVEAETDKKETPLHFAAETGHEKVVSALLASGAEVEPRDLRQRTPLHRAAEGGHLEAVEALLGAGAAVGAVDEEGETALHFAVSNHRIKVLKALVEGGARFEAKNQKGQGVLEVAIQSRHLGIVPDILKAAGSAAGALLQELPEDLAVDLLHQAAAAGQTYLFTVYRQVLINNSHLKDARDENGNTAVHVAAMTGSYGLFRVAVLENGADPDLPGGGGKDPVTGEQRNRTPLFLAAIAPQRQGGVSRNIIEMVDPLLRNGADLSSRDYEGATVLHAVAGSCEAQRTEIVLRHAARHGIALVNVTGERDSRDGGSLGWSVLHTAAKKNCNDSLPLLLEQGGTQLRTMQDSYGLTAFHVAARFASADVLRAFLEGGEVDVESRTGPASEGRTAFHLAAEGSSVSDPSFRGEGHRLAKSFSPEGQIATLRLLAKHKASATAVDYCGLTPLHVAAQAGRAGAIGFLVDDLTDDAGVKVDVSGGKDGVTPLMLAVRGTHREAVGALLQRNASLFEATERGQTPLHFAAAALPPPNSGVQGMRMVAEMARRLVRATENPSLRVRVLSARTRDWRAERPIDVAVRSGSAEVVQALLEEEVEARGGEGESERVALQRTLESPDGRLQTPILAAASEGRVDILSLLLSRGARVGVRGEGGKGLLHLAVESGSVEAVRRVLLIPTRSEPGIATAQKEEKGEGGEVEEWRGANSSDWSGGSPLHSASSLGREDIVRLLCDYGADPNGERTDAVTPLVLAARRGSLSVVRRLTSCGARGVAAVLVDASVPVDSLSLFAAKNETMGASTGVAASAQPGGMPDRGRRLALSLTVHGGVTHREQQKLETRDQAIVRALHTASAALDADGTGLSSSAALVDEEPGKGGQGTALQVAASQGLYGTAELLLKWGANVEGRSASRSSGSIGSRSAVASLPPLLLAASGGWEETARLLVRKRARVSAKGALLCGGRNGEGRLTVKGGSDSVATNRTALHCAASLNLSKLVRELLEAGAEVNSKDGGGRTPLLLAAQSLSLDSLRKLLQRAEVDLAVIDKDGKHAYSLAEEATGGRGPGGVEWEKRKEEALQLLKAEDERVGEWDDCKVFKDLCKEPLICDDKKKRLWSRETTAKQLCRPPTEWELLLRVVKQQVNRVLLIVQVSVLGVLLVAAMLIVWVIPRWKLEWKEWEMKFPPVLGAILQVNNIYTDVILIILVGAAAVKGEPAAVGLFAVSLIHAAVVVAFNAFSLWRFYKVRELQKESWWAEVRHKPLTGVLYVLGLVSLKFAMLATSNLFGVAPLSMKLRLKKEGGEKGNAGHRQRQRLGDGGEESRDRRSHPEGKDVEAGRDIPEGGEREEGGGERNGNSRGLIEVSPISPASVFKEGQRQQEEGEEKKCMKCEDRKREEMKEKERQKKRLMSAEELDRLVFSASAPATLLEEVPQLAVKVFFFFLIPEGKKILTLILGTALAALGLFLVLVRLVFTRTTQRGHGHGRQPDGSEGQLKAGLTTFRSGCRLLGDDHTPGEQDGGLNQSTPERTASPLQRQREMPRATGEGFQDAAVPQAPSDGLGLPHTTSDRLPVADVFSSTAVIGDAQAERQRVSFAASANARAETEEQLDQHGESRGREGASESASVAAAVDRFQRSLSEAVSDEVKAGHGS